MEKPDPSIFRQNPREGEYDIVFSIEGEVRREIKAGSDEEANAIADKILDAEYDDLGDLDEIGEIRVRSVRKRGPMFLVTRDGRAMQTNYLMPGDEPREPNEYGF